MKFFLSLILILITANSFSQDFINKNRSQVENELKKYIKKYRINTEVHAYDSLITFDIRDSTRRKVDYVYVFDQNGKCHTEIKMACEECILKFLKDTVKWKRYKWMAQNDSTYYSSYAGGLKMEKLRQDTLSFLIIKKQPR